MNPYKNIFYLVMNIYEKSKATILSGEILKIHFLSFRAYQPSDGQGTLQKMG